MKNKQIFRILGALASALIIVSVFVPFISVTGYSQSLWESYQITNALYLPIMIIVFGAIGVMFFALNVKTEFAYMSVGAITFFVVIRTIDILDQGVFNTLSVGYYCLVIGTFVTGIMAFLTNLKVKNKVEVVQEVKKVEETSMLDQIDKLYNEQTTNQNEISPIQPIDNVVQPLPIQPLETVTPIQPIEQPVVEEKPIEEVPINPVVQEIQMQEVPIVEQHSVVETPVNQPANPVLQEFNAPVVEEIQTQDVTVVEQQPIVETSVSQPANPVLQEFAQPTNPVVQEFGIAPVNAIDQAPIVQEQPIVSEQVATVPLININESANPTIQEFNNPGSTVAPQQNSDVLDIFGQPINKS